jgi:hypothetical protein
MAIATCPTPAIIDIKAIQKPNLLRALSSTITFIGSDWVAGWYMNA